MEPQILYLGKQNIFKLLQRKKEIFWQSRDDATIVGTGRATIVLPMGTHMTIEDALLYLDSKRTLLNYRDIRQNGFYIETGDDNNKEFLLITKDNWYGK